VERARRHQHYIASIACVACLGGLHQALEQQRASAAEGRMQRPDLLERSTVGIDQRMGEGAAIAAFCGRPATCGGRGVLVHGYFSGAAAVSRHGTLLGPSVADFVDMLLANTHASEPDDSVSQ
jgi:hypothetical protein